MYFTFSIKVPKLGNQDLSSKKILWGLGFFFPILILSPWLKQKRKQHAWRKRVFCKNKTTSKKEEMKEVDLLNCHFVIES